METGINHRASSHDVLVLPEPRHKNQQKLCNEALQAFFTDCINPLTNIYVSGVRTHAERVFGSENVILGLNKQIDADLRHRNCIHLAYQRVGVAG